MGMFDSLFVPCRDCGEPVEFQSKAGDCRLAEYTIADVPDNVAASLIGEWAYCKCGTGVQIHGRVILIPVHN
jgi:hypothetical protein